MKVGVVDVDVLISSHFKRRAGLAIDYVFGLLVLYCYLKNS